MSDSVKKWSLVAKLWFGLLLLIGIIFAVMGTKELIDVLNPPSGSYVNKISQRKAASESWILWLIYFWDWCLISLLFKRSRIALIVFVLLNVGVGIWYYFNEFDLSCIFFGGAIFSTLLAWNTTKKS